LIYMCSAATDRRAHGRRRRVKVVVVSLPYNTSH
jgi:hypothetical protein